ncbi:MAG TPA: hypothetical protein DCQ31_06100 [Bacteroidales bacterium]|nr:hypothetical protein [Bacteroidales bacterium]
MKKKNKYSNLPKTWLTLVAFFIMHAGLFAQSNVNENFLKTVFIEKFAKFTIWPYREWKTFNIGVLNDKAFFDELSKNYKTRAINGKQVVPFQITELAEIEKCDVLFVPNEFGTRIAEIAEICNKNSTLLLSEHKDMCKYGAHINFVLSETKNIYFEINIQEAEKANLRFKSKLLESAIIVRNTTIDK